ncbi:hypothetical protein D1136_03420 [Odoribacter sp. Z80]|nr:hypothetical protein [Odoribacter sp. Z80]
MHFSNFFLWLQSAKSFHNDVAKVQRKAKSEKRKAKKIHKRYIRLVKEQKNAVLFLILCH